MWRKTYLKLFQESSLLPEACKKHEEHIGFEVSGELYDLGPKFHAYLTKMKFYVSDEEYEELKKKHEQEKKQQNTKTPLIELEKVAVE